MNFNAILVKKIKAVVMKTYRFINKT